MWTDVVAWLQSAEGVRVLDSAILPFVAIVLAGVIAALIARSAVRGLMRRSERDAATSVVAATLDGARHAAVWPTLEPAEQRSAERLAGETDLRLRLTAVPGAALAADWAAMRTDRLRRIAVHFTRAPEAELDELRDGLIAWLRRPGRAKRLFAKDVAAARLAKRDNTSPDDTAADQGSADTAVAVPARTAATHDAPRHVSPPKPAVEPVAATEPRAANVIPPVAPEVTPITPARHTPAVEASGLDPDGDDVDIDPDDRVPTPPPVSASSVRVRTGGDAPLVADQDPAPAP